MPCPYLLRINLQQLPSMTCTSANDDSKTLFFLNRFLLGCIGTQDICGSFAPAPAPAPALPMAPAYPSPGAYTGYPPQSAFPGMPPDPYNPQGYPASPNIPPNMKALAQNTGAAVAAKAKLLGGLNPLKKFVPHLPPLGRPQKGKPPYNPPPPQPEPPVAGYGQGTSQMPYQQPLSYNPQGMVPPQSTGYGSPPTAGFAPPAFAVKYHHLFLKKYTNLIRSENVPTFATTTIWW